MQGLLPILYNDLIVEISTDVLLIQFIGSGKSEYQGKSTNRHTIISRTPRLGQDQKNFSGTYADVNAVPIRSLPTGLSLSLYMGKTCKCIASFATDNIDIYQRHQYMSRDVSCSRLSVVFLIILLKNILSLQYT